MKTYHLISLGCPKNLVDSEVLDHALEERGLQKTGKPAKADMVIVNTCAFIEPAKAESIDEILRIGEIRTRSGRPLLIAAGCLPQRYVKELERLLPEVDFFFGTTAPRDLPLLVEALLEGSEDLPRNRVGPPDFLMTAACPRRLTEPRFSAYLKIAEGCSNRCAYCVIPDLRGPFRSRPLEDILAEARRMAREGVREVILTAQETTAYGKDLYGRPVLGRLLKALCALEAFPWIRILYTHPARVTGEILEVMAEEESICPYLDLPVQHIDGGLLRAMRRGGTEKDIRAVIEKARQTVPGIALRTSLIVGFPGETRERFEALLRFVGEARFDHLGVFPYSREEGTAAAALPGQVRRDVKERRRDRIMAAQAAVSREINQGLVGTVQEVLVEKNGLSREYPLAGRARRQAPDVDGITYLRARNAHPGDFVLCRIVDADEYDLFGEAIP